ncbi:MAG: glycosyltransferase family 4 protein [Chloroflexota bacterium]
MQTTDYRVLLINLSTQFGGTDVRVLSQAQALQAHVAYCAVAVLEGSELHQRVEAAGLPHYTLEQGRSDPNLLFNLRRLMQNKTFHVVDTHNVISIFWGQMAAQLAGVPGRVATVHSDYLRENPNLKGRAYHTVLQSSRNVVKEYIQVTQDLQQQAIARGNQHSTWIPNAVAVPPEPFMGKDTSEYEQWGFAPDDTIIGIVGRLHPVKGHQYLIEALTHLATYPTIKLLIVGDGALEDDLKAQAQKANVLDRVHFTGFRKDIPHIMQSIDALCIASLSEAQPYVLLEATSHARPVIATAVGGLKALIEDGITGKLVPSEDSVALAEALRWLHEHPDEARTIALQGYEMVKRDYSTETMIQSVLTVYRKAIER